MFGDERQNPVQSIFDHVSAVEFYLAHFGELELVQCGRAVLVVVAQVEGDLSFEGVLADLGSDLVSLPDEVFDVDPTAVEVELEVGQVEGHEESHLTGAVVHEHISSPLYGRGVLQPSVPAVEVALHFDEVPPVCELILELLQVESITPVPQKDFPRFHQ